MTNITTFLSHLAAQLGDPVVLGGALLTLALFSATLYLDVVLRRRRRTLRGAR